MPFFRPDAWPINGALAHLNERILDRENAEKIKLLETEQFESANRIIQQLVEECRQ
jgi:hypothetical protein